jgi:aspartokinase/homoserine dehydrogenase 1
MKVIKFGGSSVGDAQRILKVKQIIEGNQGKLVVIISAFEGVTTRLINLSNKACHRDDTYQNDFEKIVNEHLQLAGMLFKSEQLVTVNSTLQALFAELDDVVNGVYLLRELSDKTLDQIISFGARVSAYLISNVVENAVFSDSREIIKTDSNFGNARVDVANTNIQIVKQIGRSGQTVIMPGFIATDAQGNVTTLGRGGSDYTAAIVAAALNANMLEIWTNVDGFMTADPAIVAKARAIESMSYAEAIELSHFGAKVIYTPTIQPVFKKNIPLYIKNTFNPSAKGTLISNQSSTEGESPIKGISSIDDVNLLTVQGSGMVGVPGTSMRVFGALAKAGVNVILITQASSEYSITFAVIPDDAVKAKKAIEEEFKNEAENGEIMVNIETEMSIIAIVGEQMQHTPGIAANLFRSLARNGISAVAVAQGSSELNISIAIRKELLTKALNAIHEGFFLSSFKELNIFVVGTGTVGGALLGQIYQQQQILLQAHKLKLNVAGIINVFKMAFDENGLDLKDFNATLDSLGEAPDLNAFVSRMKAMNLRNSVMVDCTASPEIAAHYPDVLNNFISVVTANKIANSSEFSLYKQLKETALARGVKFNYETNVGAGLPVINTINDLVKSGDRVLRIEAVLSGTLNFIFNTISKDIPLSRTIELAKEKGYSEPDPRIDLSGTDVIRKILILARESGYELEKSDVAVNTFLPADCFEGSIENFWAKVKTHDADFEARRKVLEQQGKRWRFVAIFDNGKASVQLVEVDFNHPSYVLEGSNNIIILTTERYKELPMVIKGYGAGAGVTAAGVFADILRIANV